MPSPTTVLEICRGALALTNAVGVDQTLTAAEKQDCLRVFNDLLEDWSTQNLAMFGIGNYTFNTVAGQATYTIGTGGFLNIRPVRIAPVAYTTYQGISYPCVEISQQEYNLIALKTQPLQYATNFLYVNSFPYGLLTLWPVPSEVLPITFTIDRQLEVVDNIGDTIAFPQGYMKALTYALGVELAPLFGKDIRQYPSVAAEAARTFANLKRANKKMRVMTYDPAYFANGYRGSLASFLAGYPS